MMRHIITLLISFLILSGCTHGSKNAEKKEADSLQQIFDNLDARQLISLRASQGMPIDTSDIDTIIAYFKEADAWTGLHIASVHGKDDFDRMDSMYIELFPFMDIFSLILEDNAHIITDRQMKELELTAMSMGSKIDSAARAAHIDPNEFTPFASTTDPLQSIHYHE